MEWSQDNFKDESRPKLHELVKTADYKKHDKEFSAYRFVGSLTPAAQVWIPIYKDGKPHISEKTKKQIEIPFFVTNYDYKEGKTIEGKTCPFVELAEFMNRYRDKPIRVQEFKYAQAISRNAQEEGSDDNGRYRRRGQPSAKEKSSGFKDAIDSPCRTPVEVHTISYMLGQDFSSVMALNKVKVKVKGANGPVVKVMQKSIADAKYGCDVQIKFDSSSKVAKKTSAQRGDISPLTEDEQSYLLWDLEKVLQKLVLKPNEAKIEATRILGEFKKSLKNGGNTRKAQEEPDLDDLPEDIEDMDEDTSDLGLDEDTQPKRVQGGKKQGKPKVEDDDLDLDFDDEDKPAVKKPAGKKPSKPAKNDILDDDDDLDLGDDDLDEDIPF